MLSFWWIAAALAAPLPGADERSPAAASLAEVPAVVSDRADRIRAAAEIQAARRRKAAQSYQRQRSAMAAETAQLAELERARLAAVMAAEIGRQEALRLEIERARLSRPAIVGVPIVTPPPIIIFPPRPIPRPDPKPDPSKPPKPPTPTPPTKPPTPPEKPKTPDRLLPIFPGARP